MKNYPVIYDGLKGKFRRDMAVTDIFTLAQASTNTAGATSTIAQAVTNSSKDLYITSFMVAASTAGANGYVVIGTSTVLPFVTGASGSVQPFTMIAQRNSPLVQVAAGSTITVVGTTQCGYAVQISGVYEPVYARIETEA